MAPLPHGSARHPPPRMDALVLGHRSEPLAGFTAGSAAGPPSHLDVSPVLGHPLSLTPTSPCRPVFPSHKDCAAHTGEVSCAQCCAVSIMTVELTQNPPPRDFSSPFLLQEGRLVNSKPLRPGPPGRAIGEVPTIASAPRPILCSLGLTSSWWASPKQKVLGVGSCSQHLPQMIQFQGATLCVPGPELGAGAQH